MIDPTSPWYVRKQKLSEMRFTNRVKEVPSLVLESHEVTDGVKLVKDLPNSVGAVVKDYYSDYRTAAILFMSTFKKAMGIL